MFYWHVKAWDLWKDGQSMELMDPTVATSGSMSELTLCVQVGLLCIQESAEEWLTMSDVVSILSNERTQFYLLKSSQTFIL